MFSEYLDELSDPKNREETEQYISQLERYNEVPEGKELIRPEPYFVAKTFKLNLRDGKDSSGGEGDKDKVFLNIVCSEKIMEPSKTVSKEGMYVFINVCLLLRIK